MIRQVAAPRTEFSQRTRAYNLARLRAELFDMLIIGGGITGAGIAREAALRGYKVALVEKNDFASGTSSQSSKLVQGGVHYLETLQFPLIYEASQERQRLFRIAPSLVRPWPFLYPVRDDDRYTPRQINWGLWLYEALAMFRSVARHRMLGQEELLREVPELVVPHLLGGAQYYDAVTDDARLTLETIRSAHRHGAVIVNHFHVEELVRSTGKRLDGIMGLDLTGNEYINARARVVVNATGPWADGIMTLDNPSHAPRLAPTKGVHIMVRRERFPVEQAVSFRAREDQRLMYVIPRDRYTLIGATETEFEGSPDEVCAETTDIDYILNAVEQEFPGAGLVREYVVSTYAGVRPSIAPQAGLGAGLLHEHAIWVTPSGLVNIAGGRLTTHRAMAQQLVNHVSKILRRDFGVRPAHRGRSGRVPIIEWRGKGDVLNRAQADTLETLSSATREHLDRTYGLRQGRVLDYVRADAKLRAPIVDGFPYIWAEVPHAVEQEMAVSVADVMMRRLDLFHQVPDGAVEAAHEVARYMSRLVDWFDPDVEQEVQRYAEAVELNRRALK